MDFDLEQADALLSTTRAVRKRLDLERDVPDELVLRCIELAEQAPSGGDVSSRRWLIIRDQEKKSQLANLYRAAGGSGENHGIGSKGGQLGAVDPTSDGHNPGDGSPGQHNIV